ncbi:6331_t:CDS:2, partial [Scutellospora calospora]
HDSIDDSRNTRSESGTVPSMEERLVRFAKRHLYMVEQIRRRKKAPNSTEEPIGNAKERRKKTIKLTKESTGTQKRRRN